MYKPITNPYIVGNPIKTKKMFYGREDDFEFIRRKLESGTKSYIIVLSGERRSGKTSILFQILNGELGENFIPILIDMQTMAGLKNEAEFFEKFAQETLKYLDDRFSLQNYNFKSSDESPYKVFTKLLDEIHHVHPNKNILILIDEYELIERKSEEGSLSHNFVPFLSGLLESDRHISFIFTGSRTLEERGNNYWQNLFGKSLFRNVSFLSEQDTMRLITQPVEGLITFDKKVLTAIYRLTSGQPFYTQIVGQNIVDYVNETEKNHIEIDALNQIVNEILDNPLPQMIYFWNSLPQSQMLVLSILAEILDNPDSYLAASEITKLVKKKKFGFLIDSQVMNTILEGLYHQKYVSKSDDSYSFQIDLMRQWIKRDHSIWRVMKEVDIESIMQSERPSSIKDTTDSRIESSGSNKKWLIGAAAVFVILVFAVWWIFGQKVTPEEIITEQNNKIINNQSPPANTIPEQKTDDDQNATKAKTEKQSDKKSQQLSTSIKKATIPSSEKSTHPNSEPKSPAEDVIIPYRTSMLESKSLAQKANAIELAADTYKKAANTENQAENLTRQKRFDDATEKFKEATTYYIAAEKESQKATRDAQSNLSAILAQLEDVESNLQAEHRSTEEYTNAEELRSKGERYNNEGNYILAYNSYAEAITLYEKAKQKRISQTQKIRSVINAYSSALENKNFSNASFITPDYKKELGKEWQSFFDLANEIKVATFIQNIEFNKKSATAFVDVVMTYSGAGGSGEKNRWKFELTESGTDWLILKISTAN